MKAGVEEVCNGGEILGAGGRISVLKVQTRSRMIGHEEKRFRLTITQLHRPPGNPAERLIRDTTARNMRRDCFKNEL